MRGNDSRMSPDAKAVLKLALSRFKLDHRGIHGVAHWARVRANGLKIAQLTGANVHVVESFAVIHDSCRIDDGHDPEHGLRAAQFAESLHQLHVLHLDRAELDLLTTACRWHSHGAVLDDPTINTCWDADRLDLGRVGITPDPDRLCTDAARSPAIFRWACERSLIRSSKRRVDI
jgi:uncharacterized protein